MSVALQPNSAFENDGTKNARPQQLADRLRQQIVTGHWPVDGSLPAEHELMLKFRVSRATYREALRLLESQGLLKRTRGAKGGARILKPALAPVTGYTGTFLQMHGATGHDLWQMTLLIEPTAVRMIAEHGRGGGVVAELARIAATQRFSTDDFATFIALELEFRRTLLRLCGSATTSLFGMLALELAEIHSKNVRLYDDNSSDGLMMREAVASKEKLISRMEKRQANEAERLWRSYLRSAIERTLGRAKVAGLLQLYLEPETAL